MKTIKKLEKDKIVIQINLHQGTDCCDEWFSYYLVTIDNYNIENTKEGYYLERYKFSKKYEKSYQRQGYAERYFNKLEKEFFN